MDVERIQKINKLALDLMKQGLAQSRDDAIAQAEKTFPGGQTEHYHSLRETISESPQDPVASSTQDAPAMSQDMIEKILQQNTNFLVKKIQEFQEKVASLEREMGSLRNKLKYAELPTVKEIVSNRDSPQPSKQHLSTQSSEQTLEKLGEHPAATAKSTSESHPRTGSFGDDDVSIEKFFYMGSK
jgi:hypothetical protein